MKKRLISAAIMIAIIIPLLIVRGKIFALAVGLLGVVAFKEIIDLKKDGEKRIPPLAYIFGLIAFLLIIYSNSEGSNLLFGLSYERLALAMLLTFIPVILISDFNRYSPSKAFNFFAFLLLVGLGLNLIISIVNHKVVYFIYLVSITIFTDTFAFATGMLIGKHKCAKLISPNKSWEGCIGGSVLGTILSVVLYLILINSKVNLLNLTLITFALTIIGQLGDLFFSAIKREYKIKDFSKLIPGHGGILDRIDSIIFVVIAYLIFIRYL